MIIDAFLYDAVRTSFVRYGGALSHVRPCDLGALAVRELLLRHQNLEPSQVVESVFGYANVAGVDNRNGAGVAAICIGVGQGLAVIRRERELVS